MIKVGNERLETLYAERVVFSLAESEKLMNSRVARSAMGDGLTVNFDAQSYGARVEGGYRIAVLPPLGVTPFAALQAQDFHTPGYSETDVSGGGFGQSGLHPVLLTRS